jgi:hypothetical protein
MLLTREFSALADGKVKAHKLFFARRDNFGRLFLIGRPKNAQRCLIVIV